MAKGTNKPILYVEFGISIYQNYTPDSEYDCACWRSQWFKNTKETRNKLSALTAYLRSDYEHTEYDCNGSLFCRAKIQKKGRYIRLSVVEHHDC